MQRKSIRSFLYADSNSLYAPLIVPTEARCPMVGLSIVRESNSLGSHPTHCEPTNKLLECHYVLRLSKKMELDWAQFSPP
ncbi:hypothetical protein THAOC_28437 [Thalassiosira oceanica]|uniref:Uncharacterized protein n=1 Tax=Thalassiosira oceanica TaxID=159749 RepID=K0RTU5_THAOC|nr:hypothetical protein THAOC_28437 [Thalassiosira oceanica]|eukprot:EJK52306.1 hypothetical protein THAOC_28437 [Thalassiosira oceanica]